jgi:hypothetical protein
MMLRDQASSKDKEMTDYNPSKGYDDDKGA